MIDFVPPGRQGPSYAVRMNSFDCERVYDGWRWDLLEAMKQRVRRDYD